MTPLLISALLRNRTEGVAERVILRRVSYHAIRCERVDQKALLICRLPDREGDRGYPQLSGRTVSSKPREQLVATVCCDLEPTHAVRSAFGDCLHQRVSENGHLPLARTKRRDELDPISLWTDPVL